MNLIVTCVPLLVSVLFILSVVSAGLAAGDWGARAGIPWGDEIWQLQMDPITGALVRVVNRNDPLHTNFLRDAGRWEFRNWIQDPSHSEATLDGQWGLVETAQTGLLHVGKVRPISDRAWEATYSSSALNVIVRREIDDKGDLLESYTLRNTGVVTMSFPVGTIAITAPFFDQYPDAKLSMDARCHTHIWMGGSSAWVNAMRMGTQPPHLGLVVTQGSLDAYSQRGGTFNDRGVFLLHPGAMRIERGKSVTFAWKRFWHTGWDDFFAKAQATEGFVRLSAKGYVVQAGESLEITAESAALLDSATVLANGKPVEARTTGKRLTASIPTTQPGEMRVELSVDSRKIWLLAHVTPPIGELIGSRVRFIVRNQQHNAPGDPLDGAYLAYDNETRQQVYDKSNDHNAGRERTAMGVLGAVYLPLCPDPGFKAELKQSLTRYAAFVARELEDENGVVYNDVGRAKYHRPYNAPWMAHFHLAMYRGTGDVDQLDRFVRVVRAYYADKGAEHYSIGVPISGGLSALRDAGRVQEHDELLAHFRANADHFREMGTNYPRHEVNYEQSIVAPAVQLLAEMAVVTGDKSYLDAVSSQMPLLEAFCGRQPDSRLNEIAIRHWDSFWFGKHAFYGDTMPHYWSTLNATAYAWFGIATNDPDWHRRADSIVKANLSLFNPDGSASCAPLYPFSTNGHRAGRNDPWANDQDWALVNLLTVRELAKP